MVRKIVCDCDERVGTDIDSIKMLDYINEWINKNLEEGVFEELEVSIPFAIDIGKNESQTIRFYADKWYKCRNCGTFWEIIYPDFPMIGTVRKFIDGEKYVSISEKPL